MPLANAGAQISSSDQISDGIIVNADINAAAAIEATKIKTLNVGVEGGVIPSTGIDNADIAAGAAIDESKISGAVDKTSTENVGGVKTFTDDPIIPAEAYGAGWAASNEPATKKDIYAKINSMPTTDYTNIPGALPNIVVKTYFNIVLPFILWIGGVANDTTTTFINWVRSSGDFDVGAGGLIVNILGTGLDTMSIDFWKSLLKFNSTNILIVDFWAQLPATSAGDIFIGFNASSADFGATYNAVGNERVGFSQRGSTGALYATSSVGAAITNTDISAGITITNWNNYRIEYDIGTDIKFYVNGTLKATINTNLPTANSAVLLGFGRSDTALFKVTAPTLSLQMNP